MRYLFKLFISVCCVFICDAEPASHHCCPDSILVSVKKCKDGRNISMSCEEYPSIMDPSRSTYAQFSISVDRENDGREYLDAYVAGYHIFQPYFCTGDIQYSFSNRTSYNVAVTCSSYRKWYKDVNVNGGESVQKAKYYRLFSFLVKIFNFTSAVLLLTTALIYYALPNVQNVQDSCYFYFTFVAGLGHSTLTYMEIFDQEGLLPDMCITNIYLLVYLLLCMMTWSNVTSYHIWRSAMNYHTDNEAELLKRYKMCGFGVPFCLIFLTWIHVHLSNTGNTIFVTECWKHYQVMYTYYITFPVMASISLNFLMFVHSQMRVWSSHSIQLQDRKLAMKILKYRLFMNAKLFFMMGVPWILVVILYIYDSILEIGSGPIATLFKFSVILLVLVEGIPVFLILVIFRKRVLRGMGNKWFANTKIYPDKWKTARDSETDEEVTDDETPSRSPEAKYSAKINNNSDNDKNILDESAIVIL